MAKTLRFHDLDHDYTVKYLEFTNDIANLQLRLKRSVPIRAGMALFTMGASLLISAPRTAWHVGKIYTTRDAAKNFIENEQRRQKRDHIEWNTFPSAHAVIGGEPIQTDDPLVKCPLCKEIKMRRYVACNHHEIMNCNNCDRTIAIKVDRKKLRTEEILIPGMFALPIPFTHPIDHLDDLGEHLSNYIDIIGIAAESIFDTVIDIIL